MLTSKLTILLPSTRTVGVQPVPPTTPCMCARTVGVQPMPPTTPCVCVLGLWVCSLCPPQPRVQVCVCLRFCVWMCIPGVVFLLSPNSVLRWRLLLNLELEFDCPLGSFCPCIPSTRVVGVCHARLTLQGSGAWTWGFMLARPALETDPSLQFPTYFIMRILDIHKRWKNSTE